MVEFMIIVAGLLILFTALLLLCGSFIALMISITARIWDNRIRPWLDKRFGESDW